MKMNKRQVRISKILKKLSEYFFLTSLISLIIFFFISWMDYKFKDPNIMDCVYTCHDFLMYPVMILYGVMMLSFLTAGLVMVIHLLYSKKENKKFEIRFTGTRTVLMIFTAILVVIFLVSSIVLKDPKYNLIEDELRGDQHIVYTIMGKDYEVTTNYLDRDGAVFEINGESLRALKEGEKATLKDGAILEVNKIYSDDFEYFVHFTLERK